MMAARHQRLWVAFVAGALALSACGQYEGVHENAVASGDIDQFGAAGSGTGTGPGGELGAGNLGPGGPGGPAGAGSGLGKAGGKAGGVNGPSGGTGNQGGSGNTTGVTSQSITIGVHAPITGAAPLRNDSFNIGKDLFWKHGNNGRPVTVYGRQVRVLVEDDQYRPSTAKQVCESMVERGNAFLLIGGGGTDQIQACAQYAAGQGIPYLSAGVTELGLGQLGNYFPTSMSYPQQVHLLAPYIKKYVGVRNNSRIAAVITNTPNFKDAAQAFARALPGARIFQPDKNDRGSSMAGNLCTGTVKNYDVVFPLMAPTAYLEMASTAACKPRYVGVGVSMGLDTVASTGCQARGSTENARFFSPAPAFEDARRGKWDPGFVRAAQAAGVAPDDIMWLFWGQSRVLHQLLVKAGPNLSRERFIATSARASVRTGIYPDLQYSPSNHFGARHVHVLRNVCRSRGNQAGYYVTEAAFVSRF